MTVPSPVAGSSLGRRKAYTAPEREADAASGPPYVAAAVLPV